MGLYKRAGSDTWHCEFVIDGERVRTSTGATRKRDAEVFERQLWQKLYDQKYLGAIEEMTLGAAIKRFDRTVMTPRGNEGSAMRDRYVFRRLLKAFGEDTLVSSLTARQITRFRDDLLGEGLKPATANRYLAILRSILRTAKREWNALAVVPMIKLLPLNNRRYRFLSDDEEARLLDVCSPLLRSLVIFLLGTGARKSEALRLTWADVDLDRKPRPIARFMVTKNQTPRAVPLCRRVEALLRELYGEGQPASRPVFTYEGSRWVQPHGAWKTACARAGLTDVVMHDLRHTFASRLVMCGVPLIHVSKLLGHSDIRMTMRYAHLAAGALDDVIGVLDVMGGRKSACFPSVSGREFL